MKGDSTTEQERVRSQKRNRKWNDMGGLEWKWIRVCVIEVVDRKNGIRMNGNEWIQNIDANRNKEQR